MTRKTRLFLRDQNAVSAVLAAVHGVHLIGIRIAEQKEGMAQHVHFQNCFLNGAAQSERRLLFMKVTCTGRKVGLKAVKRNTAFKSAAAVLYCKKAFGL